MQPPLAAFLEQVLATAQAGLTYSRDPFDIERFERIREISAEIMSHQSDLPIEKVKELLVYDELSLSEIALRLNYSSVAYLSNQFKKVTGLTPSYFKQIKEGKPLTITNPEMTRFMMSLEDSVELVMYAFLHGNPGDIFVQKSPGATIEVLAIALKELFKKNNEININDRSYCNKFDNSTKFDFIEILPKSNFTYIGIGNEK